MRTEMDGAASLATPNSPDNHIRLACQACQRKKIKCDRNFPCTQCVKSNLQCFPSTRKPRARHAGRRAVDSELRNRISKLENLVDSLSGDPAVASDGSLPGRQADAQTSESPAVGRYIGSQFWSSLTGEVQALKEALEDEQAEDDEPTSPTASSVPSSSADYELLVCPPGLIYVMPGALPEPPPHISAALCEAFCNNIDRMTKVFHAPTLRAFMIDGQPYLGQDPVSPANKAVKAAIWFAATNTLSESQCQMMFGRSRSDQLHQFRKMVDIAIAQADLFTTTDLATLQALATYCITSRRSDPSRRMWTMVATLVRVARAMGLHHEVIRRTPFETELRRRLWHNIRFIDVFACWDRGSADLLIGNNTFDTPRPRNIDDSKFDEFSASLPEETPGLTGMSFASIAIEAVGLTNRFTGPESKPDGGDTWEDRLELTKKFEAEVNEKYLKHYDTTDPFHRFLAGVFQSMIISQKLRAARPFQKHPLSTAPRVDTPYSLQLASDSLRASELIFEDPSTEQFRWLAWIPWHPLAVALAALCAIRDTELANTAWINVENAYRRQASVVADAQGGMLWRPIEKLYKKALAFREHREETPSDTIASPPQPFPPPSTTSAYPAPPQIDPNLAPSITQSMPGAMPTTGMPNPAMNMDFGSAVMGDLDLSNSNMNWWMDFQNIFEDMATPNPDVNMENIAWAAGNMPQNTGWGPMMPQNQMG